ncbi:MAG: O-antigen ligase family protein [Chthoniobacter sp.]|uniref:O-antigen ligase family protein n=1 Tax=Chthoniobacter sp. TaxID=2510640 RepID=UPI0032AC4AAC
MRYLTLTLLALSLVCIQVMIGGVRLVFSLPAYFLLASASLLTFLAFKKLARPPLLCALTASLLAAWVVGRALSSPVVYLARADLFMILGAVLVYLLTVMHLTATRTRHILVGILLLFALVHVAIGAIQFKQGDEFMLLPGIMRSPYGWRASGFYICPNHLAGLLEMLAMLAVGQACWGSSRPAIRILAGYCALMCLAGLAVTGSRGGYLSVVFGLGVFAILSLWAVKLTRRGGFWVMFAGILAGAVVILGGALFVMSQSETIYTRLMQVYDPSNMRLLMWKAAVTQYHLEPLTGTGSGTYLFYGRQFRSPLVQNDPMHVHNDYLELLAEYGLIGTVLCGAFLLVHLVSGMAGLRKIVLEQIRPGTPRLSNDLALDIGALAAIAALLMHSVVDFNMHIPANALVVAFLFGILARPMGDSEGESGQPVQAAGWWRWLAAAVAVVLLGLSARLLPGEILAEKARVALRDDRNSDALALANRGLAWEKKNPFLYGYRGEAEHFLTLSAPDEVAAHILHEDAATDYERALKLFPQDTGLLLKEAQILDLMGRYADAEDVFQRLFKCDPLFGNVYAFYGLHWQLQKRMKAAELCFRVAKKLGETEISPKSLQNLEQLKADPMAQTLFSHFTEPQLNLPAEWILSEP